MRAEHKNTYIKRKKLKSLLAEGYVEMAGESLKIIQDFKNVDKEIKISKNGLI